MRQITNIAVEVWHRAIKGSLGYVHPTLFRFIDFLQQEQSAAENKLSSGNKTNLQAGKEFPKKPVIKRMPFELRTSSKATETIELSLHLMDFRTTLILFSTLMVHL